MHIWTRVAEIGRTKTLDGGLVVRGATGLPFLLSEGMELTFVPPRLGVPRKARVVSVKPLKGADFLVHFDMIGNIDTATSLVGCSCLAKRSDLPNDFDLQQPESLQGVEVVDVVWGSLGHVSDYSDNGAQALFSVEGVSGTILIPDVPEFITEVDLGNRRITTRIPKGLLELANDTRQA